MAKKTAMRKEPSNVSVALPKSEKDRLSNAGTFLPGSPGMANKIIEGAKPLPLKRLSPGVYRNSQGQLVGNKGQPLPGQRRQSPIEAALGAANQSRPQQQPPASMPQNGNAPSMVGQIMQDMPAENPNEQMIGRAAENRSWGNKPYFNNMPQMSRPFMGQNPMMGGFSPEQMNQLYQRFEQPQQSQSVSGMLQQGGQPQQQMPFPQMGSPMPQMTPEQFQQMQMGAPQPMAQANQRFVPYKG